MLLATCATFLALGVLVAWIWFRHWSPDACRQHARALVAANAYDQAETFLQESIVFHSTCWLSSDDDVWDLQACLIGVYSDGKDMRNLEAYLSHAHLGPIYRSSRYRLETKAEGFRTLAKHYWNAESWKQSHHYFRRAASTEGDIREHTKSKGGPDIYMWVQENYANAALAASNGRLYEDAKSALREFCDIECKHSVYDGDLVALVAKHPQIRPQNFWHVEKRVAGSDKSMSDRK